MGERLRQPLPDDFAQQVVADMHRRAEEAGTTLPELLRSALISQKSMDESHSRTLSPGEPTDPETPLS